MPIKTLEEEPELDRHLNWVWQAFSDLNYRRGIGMSGPVPITYTDIEAYCRLKGIYLLGERERLLRAIDALDRAYMAKHYEETASGPQGGPPTTPPKTPPPTSPRRPPRKEVR